ncbi:hypothetical protein N9N28_14020 [Rubripirellula amarantea]|nr:hypothetical protein [Rubripirellula amarantea]
MPGTSIRPLARMLEGAGAIVWVINPVGRLAYVSAGVGEWLHIEPAELLDRQAIAGAAVSDQWQDHVAAALSAPPGLVERGTASLKITPPKIALPKVPPPTTSGPSTTSGSSTSEAKARVVDVRFISVGCDERRFTIAFGGAYDDRLIDAELGDALQLRQRLDRWRQQNQTMQAISLAGSSTLVKRLRNRVKVASLARTDALLVGVRGSAGETIAVTLHHASAPGEPMANVDGSLMDTELLDATLSPLLSKLNDAREAKGTVIVRGLDRTSTESQQRLAQLHLQYEGRLRLIATARHVGECNLGDASVVASDSASHDNVSGGGKSGGQSSSTAKSTSSADLASTWQQVQSVGIISKLVDVFCATVVPIPSLTDRIDDIPVLATALLEHWHAKRECTSERFNRAALDALVVYPWPGDFRELEQTVRAAARTAPGSVVGVEHLPLAVRSYRPGDPVARAKVAVMDLDDAVRRFEAKLIQAAIEATEGNRAEAARRLGISRARLLRKLEEAGGDGASDANVSESS